MGDKIIMFDYAGKWSSSLEHETPLKRGFMVV